MENKFEEKNIKAFIDYWKNGVKKTATNIGIELEQFVVNEDLSPVTYNQNHGIKWLLNELSDTYPQVTTNANGDTLGVSRKKEAITLEPAGQVEISAGPYDDLNNAYEVFKDYQETLTSILKPHNMRLLQLGYRTKSKAKDLPLIPKKRYIYMDRYLSKTGRLSKCMMRGSASTQISIDYTSIDDCMIKLKLAFALTPILSLICDNTPIFEESKWNNNIARTHIWNNVDNKRCGLITNVFNTDFKLEDIARYILNNVSIIKPINQTEWQYSEDSFNKIYSDKKMTQFDIEHALSMVFTDVRLKNYIEIRPADSMPIDYVISYAALIKAIFYSNDNIKTLQSLFNHVDSKKYNQAKENLIKDGYNAHVYSLPVTDICDLICKLATSSKSGLLDSERHLLNPLLNLIKEHTTLSDIFKRRHL